MRIPKGFMSIGKGATLNVALIDKVYINDNNATIIDKYGTKYKVDKKLVKGQR